jgi:hypothetical protein
MSGTMRRVRMTFGDAEVVDLGTTMPTGAVAS